MALSVAALWRMSSGVEFRFQKTIALLLVLAASVVPFAFNPADFRPHRLDLNPLYQNAEAPKLDLRKGKHVVAFMSLGCPHCREAARILEQFRTENPRVPLFMVLHGRKVDAPDFFQATGAVQVPHMIYDNTEAFVKMAGPYVPAIYFVHDSRVERSLSYPQLNRVSIEQWASH
jgi:thiol-disulfide isomerase/thioredoxin